jgi:hypothetical protein
MTDSADRPPEAPPPGSHEQVSGARHRAPIQDRRSVDAALGDAPTRDRCRGLDRLPRTDLSGRLLRMRSIVEGR